MPQATPTAPPIPDTDAATRLVMQLMAIPGRSGEERAVAEFIVGRLRDAGVPESSIRFDTANRKSASGGQVGNLIVKLPGTRRGTRRMLMAHLDTVPICVGCEPVRRGGRIVSAKPGTGLGADDRSGAAVVLHTALKLLEDRLPHGPLTLLWCVQEEVGLVGARNVSPAMLGRPAMAFNFDSSDPEQLIIGATGASRMTVEVCGVASHAGVHPERGVSATAIAALAIADLQRSGWHGLIAKGAQRGTSNVGVIHGGEATNVVTDRLTLKAEARSHNPRFRARIIEAYRRAFDRAARQVRSDTGRRGEVSFEVVHSYESFKLRPADAVVRAAAAAVSAAGQKPRLNICNGGLDANCMNLHGVPTVTLGTGQHEIHTVNEYLDLAQFHAACGVALTLARSGDMA